jgi:hypothetical protein
MGNLVYVNFGLFSPKDGCFILVCEILAIFVSSVFNFGHLQNYYFVVFILNAFYFMLFKYLNS